MSKNTYGSRYIITGHDNTTGERCFYMKGDQFIETTDNLWNAKFILTYATADKYRAKCAKYQFTSHLDWKIEQVWMCDPVEVK